MADAPVPPSSTDTPPSADSPQPAPQKPIRIPPSVGGSGLSIVSGLLLGRNAVEGFILGVEVQPMAWVVPVVLLAFVVVLIQFALMARERVGIQVSPASVRQQWLVMAGAFGAGLLVGAAFPYVNGA